MKRTVLVLSLCTLAWIAAGCATKGSVKHEVARIDQQLGTISTSVESNETRIKEQDSRLADHDQKIAELSKESQEALQRGMAAEKLAQGKLLYEVTLTDDNMKFDFGKSDIKPQGKDILDNLVNQLKADNKNVYIEIQGHTDAVGTEDYNYKLGLERAETVRHYLSDAGIPLHRISIISYGKDRPVADNKTKDGRRQNRRVVIQVLA